MSTFIHIEEPVQSAARGSRFALWELGFRPFYLLAAVFSAFSVAAWAAQFGGWLPHAYLAGSIWHAHEMLFGFVLAVIVGFLFTAARTWTGRPTPTGVPLMMLALLWVAARVLVLTPWGWAAALANTAFPLAAAMALAVPLVRARARRNYVFVALLTALAAASAVVHAVQLGMIDLPAWFGVHIALDVVLFVMVLMAGRVIPAFTNSGVPGSGASRVGWLEMLALGIVLSVLAADLLQIQGIPLAVLLVSCALVHGARLTLWHPLRTLRTPLVWVLHVAYAWIVLHFLLRGLSVVGVIPSSVATHALAAGAIGSLTLGMMTRTARGHTARPLKADRIDLTCYLLVLAAACVRVFVPLSVPALLVPSVLVSGLLWSAAFGLFAIRYWPILSRSRLDGKPG